MNCDLCGKEAEMYKAVIEGSQMTVCKGCSEYGSNVERTKPVIHERMQRRVETPKSDVIEAVVSNLGELLKRKREEIGLKQKDFAKKIAEKESTLHKLETGTITPTLERARKLEKMLGLTLVEELKEEPIEKQKDTSVITLGDMVKITKTRGKIP